MASAIIAFCACNKESLPVQHAGIQLTINATVGAPTKTAYSYDPESKEMDVTWKEEEHISVAILKELVGSVYMTVRTAQNLSILHASSSQRIIIDGLIHLTATLHDTHIVVCHTVEHIIDAYVAIMSPIALVALVEVFDVPYLIVPDHSKAAALCSRTEIMHISQCRQ